MNLTVSTTSEVDDRCTVTASGVLDLASRADFLSHSTQALTSCAGGTLVLDLSAVTFVDSSGLGGLVAILDQGRAQGTRVVIADPSPRVARLLELTALDQVFDVTSTAGDVTDDAASAAPEPPAS